MMEGYYMNAIEREKLLTMLDAICADDETRELLINQLLSLQRQHEPNSMRSPVLKQGEYQ